MTAAPTTCPRWENHPKSAGGRDAPIPMQCIKCGTRVAVSHDVWRRQWKERPLNVICEQCAESAKP